MTNGNGPQVSVQTTDANLGHRRPCKHVEGNFFSSMSKACSTHADLVASRRYGAKASPFKR